MPGHRELNLPSNVQLVAPCEKLAFLDCQAVALSAAITPLEAWRRIMARPLPGLGLAFRLRDAVSARLGVARIVGFSGSAVTAAKVGDRLDFFLIEQLSVTALTLTARDRHLDVMVCVTTEGNQLAITASVITKNWFGRAYMVPVAPAHRVIVRAMLRRLRRDIAGQQAQVT